MTLALVANGSLQSIKFEEKMAEKYLWMFSASDLEYFDKNVQYNLNIIATNGVQTGSIVGSMAPQP